MRRWIQSLVCCLLTVFSSCIMDIDKELPDCLPDKVTDPIAVTASLYCNGHQITWPDNSHIGVIMLQGATNKFAYTTPAKEYFLPDTSDYLFLPFSELQQIGRPAKGTTQDATGIYPHNLTVDDNLKVPFSVADQTDQQALDLILAKRTTGITEATDTVHLDFYRQLARLQFNLSLTEIDADGNSNNADAKLVGAQVSIAGMDASALFSLSDLSCTTSGTDSIRALVATDGKSGQAIVFPREASDKVTFTVTLPAYPDTVYTFAMDPQLEISSCKTYSFNMNLAYRYDSDKPGPGPGPAIEHHIDYVFEGDANSSNTDVFKNGDATAWPLGEIITVDDHGCFTFGYDSDLAVSIRTKDGKVIPLNPKTSYTFIDITGDITIIISAKHTEEPGPGPAPDPEPDPSPNPDPTPDPDPDPTPPPTPIYHKIIYEYKDGLNGTNVPVQGTIGMSPQHDWEPNMEIFVQDGGSFTFLFNKENNFTDDITVTLNSEVIQNIKAGEGYTISSVKQDLHFILYGERYHQVTVITNLTNNPSTTEENTLVVHNNRYEWTFPSGLDPNELLIKVDGKTYDTTTGGKVTIIDGKLIIESVKEDTVIVITNKKENGREPDLIIKADVHDWVELPIVDGGIITPDTKKN